MFEVYYIIRLVVNFNHFSKEQKMKSKIYNNLKSGDTRTITFHGRLVKQIYLNNIWVTVK